MKKYIMYACFNGLRVYFKNPTDDGKCQTLDVCRATRFDESEINRVVDSTPKPSVFTPWMKDVDPDMA